MPLMNSSVQHAATFATLIADHAVGRTMKARDQQDSSSAGAGRAAEPDAWGVGHMCGLLEDLLRADAQALAQLGGSSSGSSGSLADLEVHAQLQRNMLPAQGDTQSPLCDCLVSSGADLGSQGASQLLGLLVAMLNWFPFLLQQSDPACAQIGARICAATLKAAVQVLCKTSAAAQQDGSGAAAAATAVLPWLVLLGRCYLLFGEDEQGGELRGAAAFMALPCLRFGVQGQGETSMFATHDSIICLMELLGSPHAAHLSGLGYDLQPLLQRANDLGTAYRDYAAAPDRAAALQRVNTQLKALGRYLCAFAVPDMCNNPLCRNVCGPSEAALVGGRSCLCGGCLVARYCSRACQKQQWKGQHKPVCEALAATAAAAAGGDSH
jgi:hypothetical protein